MRSIPGLLAASALAAASVLPAEPAAAQLSGCGYGSGGEYASTICWIDMSGFDMATAMSPAGRACSSS